MRILQLSHMVFCLYQRAFHYTYSMKVMYNFFCFMFTRFAYSHVVDISSSYVTQFAHIDVF